MAAFTRLPVDCMGRLGKALSFQQHLLFAGFLVSLKSNTFAILVFHFERFLFFSVRVDAALKETRDPQVKMV